MKGKENKREEDRNQVEEERESARERERRHPLEDVKLPKTAPHLKGDKGREWSEHFEEQGSRVFKKQVGWKRLT